IDTKQYQCKSKNYKTCPILKRETNNLENYFTELLSNCDNCPIDFWEKSIKQKIDRSNYNQLALDFE
ncbi:MAG: hypothetical protein K2J74_04545, partial [Muribaculaceae bacterium]|nr:hypothetical protein [Muribaculaceae bacterium]